MVIPATSLALLLHLAVETPACVAFLVAPHAQLPPAGGGGGASSSLETRLVLRNLGGLLAATNLAVLVLLRTPAAAAETRALVARLCLCLGTYHVWPLRRAWVRMRLSSSSSSSSAAAAAVVVAAGPREEEEGRKEGEKVLLGGPVVHLVAHVLCLAALLWAGLAGVLSDG
ncbi:hypothetical protein VTH06DRAFT_7114 [Thermothelomyces fergusii]